MRKMLQSKLSIYVLLVLLSLTLISCSFEDVPNDSTTNTNLEQNNEGQDIAVVDFDNLQNNINKDRFMGVVQNLVDIGPRVAGSTKEVEAGDYILSEFENVGLISSGEDFRILTFEANEWDLTVHSDGQSFQVDSTCLTYSGSTPSEGLKNVPLIFGNFGLEDEVSDIDMEGKLAVVRRGDISLIEKVTNCFNQGALGVIIVNSDDNPLNGGLGERSPIPVVGITLSEGNKIIDSIDNNDVAADLLVDTTIGYGDSRNIIGLKKSNVENAKKLIIGAHYDSVDSPGANDNASGIGALIELANILKDEKLPFDIEFIAFGSEEIGRKGSYSYVNTRYYYNTPNRDNVIGFINMDMVAMGEYLAVLRKDQTRDITLFGLAYKAAKELDLSPQIHYSQISDPLPFDDVDIPVVFLSYYPHDPAYYHTEKDTIDTLDSSLVTNVISVVLRMVEQLSVEVK